MAISLVASTEGSGTQNANTTGSINTTGANLIVISVAYQAGATPSISDSKGNTWTPLTQTSSGSTACRMYYCFNPTVGTGHTFSNGGSGNYSSMFVEAFQSDTGWDTVGSQNGAAATAGDLATGSVTPPVDGCLLVTGAACNQSCTPMSINNSFNKTDEINFSSGNRYGGAMAYLVQSTAGAINPTWDRSGSHEIRVRIAVFIPVTSVYGISGVVTLQGEPVEGATIRCIKQSDNTAIAAETTDESGAYLFSGLEEGELYHLAVEFEADEEKYNARSLWDVEPVELE